MPEAGKSLEDWVKRKGYALHNAPQRSAGARSYWTKSNKHRRVTTRDIEFLTAYVAIALAFGTKLTACGIDLGEMRFVYLDVAVMNSCLNSSLVEINESSGTFELTRKGLAQLKLWLE